MSRHMICSASILLILPGCEDGRMEHIGLTQFKLHSLRHRFATRPVSAGVDIYTVKKLPGHQDIRTSMVYAKANTDTLRDAVKRLKN